MPTRLVPLAGGSTELDDATLVRYCVEGDTQAICTLLERFHARVYGRCMQLLGHVQDAEDGTQEVFLRVFRSLRSWDSARPLGPWIIGITNKHCCSRLSGRCRLPKLGNHLFLDTASDNNSVEEEFIDAEKRRQVWEEVNNLPPEYRAVIVLRYSEKGTLEKIQELLGLPTVEVVRWRLSRAFKILRARLGGVE